eukprot:475479_1
MTLCAKTCTAIGRYYAAFGRPYDSIFSVYCEENGCDMSYDDFIEEMDMSYDDFIEEMDMSFEDCMLVDFDQDFPFAREPHNDRTKRQFIYLLIKKCMSNPDITFSKLQIDVSLPEEKAQQITDTVYKKQ